jgi:PAS domain S-box-containing protein
VALCIQVTLVLWSQVLHKLDALSVAVSDNSEWTLSQLEVEFVQLKNAALLAERDATGAPEDVTLAQLRERFDIFYSRVGIIAGGRLYRPIADAPEVRQALGRIEDFLSRAVPLIDGEDSTLRSGLEPLHASMEELRGDVRTVVLAGVARFSALAIARRDEVARLLMQVAAVTIALVVALVGFALVLVGLNRIAKRRAEDLAITGERLSTVVSTALDAIIVADAAGHVSEYNPAAERIFGWRRDAAVGRLLSDFMLREEDGDDPAAEAVQTAGEVDRSLPASGRFELQARRANGSLFPAEVSIASAPGPEGELRIAFLRDVSQRVANERALREARDRALAGERAKARFLAVMSHEMRTPLNGLLGSLELLEHGALDPGQRRHLATLRSSGELLLQHVNDVLDISRLDAAAYSFVRDPIDPAALLAEVAESQRARAAEAGNHIALVLPPEPGRPALLGDPRSLRQALLNLLGNAIKFTRNGRITLALTTGAETEEGLAVEFRVTDTGPGIPPEDHARIFEDFVTLDASYGRQAEGTGLGLPITRRLVTAMGGEIGVDSRPGQGSTFWFRLSLPLDRSRPAAGPAAAAPATDAAVSAPSGPPLHLLMIEDNEVNRAILRAFLGKLGHSVDEAQDGDEGIRLAALRRYDLILTDISMPRVSGVEATRAIRAGPGASRDVPIVAVTAHALPEELAAFRAAGIDGVLTKPIRLKTLAETIAVHRAGTAGAATGEGTAPGSTMTGLPQGLPEAGAPAGASV